MLAPLSSSFRPQAAKSTDTLILELPFFDDFSDYEGVPDARRWLSTQAFVNKDYAPQAPTIGMVTLDALDAYGNLYPQASTNLFAADTLMSQTVRLDSMTGTYQRLLQPSDSIYLSFYYLPGGWYGYPWELVGDAPSSEDSLFLDFYDADGKCWNTVWATEGHNADTTGITCRWPWRFVNVKIDDLRYFNRDFRFRFRNYASLDPNPKSGIAGNCDQWNIDYVYINYNRSAGDSIFRDIAFVEKAPSMLKRYQAMPARQYSSSDMVSSLDIKIVNRYNQTLASTYTYSILDKDGQQLSSYDGGYENIVPFYPNGNYQEMGVHSTPPVTYTFPETAVPARYKIVHIVREGVGGDIHNSNDTMSFDQVLGDYYAYDDGTPENGYGLTTSSSKLWLAYRFDLKTPDTLTAVDLYFNRTRNGENEDVQFHLCVWESENGRPSTMIYKDATRMMPEFDGLNRFHRYKLTDPIIVSDTVFIGFEQLSNDYINLGFDRSTDSREYTYYRAGSEWMQSILKGSVMMRPAFGTSALVAIPEEPQALDIQIYPNPANERVFISLDGDCDGEQFTLTLYDIQGRRLLEGPLGTSIETSTLANGIYILRIFDSTSGRQTNSKLIIRH